MPTNQSDKLFGLDQKSQFKTNKYANLYIFMSNNTKKTCQNGSKMTVFDIILLQKGLCVVCKKIDWPVSHRLGYEYQIFLNNYFNRIFCPSLLKTRQGKYLLYNK